MDFTNNENRPLWCFGKLTALIGPSKGGDGTTEMIEKIREDIDLGRTTVLDFAVPRRMVLEQQL